MGKNLKLIRQIVLGTKLISSLKNVADVDPPSMFQDLREFYDVDAAKMKGILREMGTNRDMLTSLSKRFDKVMTDYENLTTPSDWFQTLEIIKAGNRVIKSLQGDLTDEEIRSTLDDTMHFWQTGKEGIVLFNSVIDDPLIIKVFEARIYGLYKILQNNKPKAEA